MENTEINILCPECGSTNNSQNSLCKECGNELILNNKYFLLKILGENIGTTYLATDNNNKHVIIKELSLRRVDKWKTHELFKREGEILSQLNHKSIPEFIEEFETGIGRSARSYLVIENIDGINLREEFNKKRYTEKEVIEIAIETAKILDYLHNLMPPVIHRDIKLSNLMRKSDGTLALIDFGSVKDAMRDKNATISGTMGFMAPEQLTGSPVIASDFYSLGAVLLVLLSRKEIDEMTENGIDLKWEDSVHVSNKMQYLLKRLLEKNHENRLNTLKEMEEILLTDKYDKKKSKNIVATVTNVTKSPSPKEEKSEFEFMKEQNDDYLTDFDEGNPYSVYNKFEDKSTTAIIFIVLIIFFVFIIFIFKASLSPQENYTYDSYDYNPHSTEDEYNDITNDRINKLRENQKAVFDDIEKVTGEDN